MPARSKDKHNTAPLRCTSALTTARSNPLHQKDFSSGVLAKRWDPMPGSPHKLIAATSISDILGLRANDVELDVQVAQLHLLHMTRRLECGHHADGLQGESQCQECEVHLLRCLVAKALRG